MLSTMNALTNLTIIISNFENSCPDEKSRFCYFNVDSNAASANILRESLSLTNPICLPFLLKSNNLNEKKPRFMRKMTDAFLKLNLELIKVMRPNSSEFEENISEEKLNFMNTLDSKHNPSYCYFNDDPTNDIILCLSNGEFMRQFCPQYSNANHNGWAILLLDKEISLVGHLTEINLSTDLLTSTTTSSSFKRPRSESGELINPENSQSCKAIRSNNSSNQSINSRQSETQSDNDEDIRNNNSSNNGGKSKWTDDLIREEALKYNMRKKFKKNCNGAYDAARRLGILDEICQHMTSGNHVSWTDDLMREEALKYSTRNEFQKGSIGAYDAARRLGILDEICQHMISRFTWTDDMIREEALKYNTRSEFCKGSVGAYDAARRLGILDEICQHMMSVKRIHDARRSTKI